MGPQNNSDLLRSLLDFEPENGSRPNRPIEITTIGRHSLVLVGCCVTIHQPPAEAEEPAS
jgi:hypothetical protein